PRRLALFRRRRVSRCDGGADDARGDGGDAASLRAGRRRGVRACRRRGRDRAHAGRRSVLGRSLRDAGRPVRPPLVRRQPNRGPLAARAPGPRRQVVEGAAVMTTGRMALTVFAAFFVQQILAIAIHGFILAADYAPYYGTLLRSMDTASWQMLLLPASH